MILRFPLRLAAVGTTAAGLLMASTSMACAHVRVTPDTASPGDYLTLTFKVPTESETASTVKLEVDLPTDHPFGSVSYEPVSGWKTTVLTSKLATPVTTDDGTITQAPTKVTWTAAPGSGVAPGQFLTFAVSVGPVPDTGEVQLDARQTYSDGSIVNWDQKTPASGAEPEHPAPVLYIKDAPPGVSAAPTTDGASSAAASPSSNAAGVTMASSADQTPPSSDTTARWLGIAGLVVGAAGLVAAVWALTRRPRNGA